MITMIETLRRLPSECPGSFLLLPHVRIFEVRRSEFRTHTSLILGGHSPDSCVQLLTKLFRYGNVIEKWFFFRKKIKAGYFGEFLQYCNRKHYLTPANTITYELSLDKDNDFHKENLVPSFKYFILNYNGISIYNPKFGKNTIRINQTQVAKTM